MCNIDWYFGESEDKQQIEICVCSFWFEIGKIYPEMTAYAHSTMRSNFVDVTRLFKRTQTKILCYANKKKVQTIFFHPISKPEMCVM